MLHGGYFDGILSPLCHITNGSRVGLWLEFDRFILCDQGSLLFRLSMNPLAHSVYSPHQVFKSLLKKAELRRVRFHDLRHTFASLLLQQGESPVYVKEQMGHSSIQVTVDLYGHLIPGGNTQAVDRLDQQPEKMLLQVESATQAQPV